MLLALEGSRYKVRLARLGPLSSECTMLSGDLINVYKILRGTDKMNICSLFSTEVTSKYRACVAMDKTLNRPDEQASGTSPVKQHGQQRELDPWPVAMLYTSMALLYISIQEVEKKG